MGLELAKIVAKLVEGIGGCGQTEGGEDDLVYAAGSPPVQLRPPCSRASISRVIRVSWILMRAILVLPAVTGKANR
jgi:hypothetical protein